MKIAVLFYGQPRFFDLTKERFLEEYSFSSHTVDFFIHFWEEIGFVPDCDKQVNYIVNENLIEDIDLLKPKKYSVTSYAELDTVTSLLKNTLSFLKDNKIQFRDFPAKSRYNFGQHLSLKKAYALMERYEQELNFKYDLVIKVRPDFIFKDRACYSNDEKYEKAKLNFYGLDNTGDYGDNYVHVCAVAKQRYDLLEKKWKMTTINTYDPSVEIERDKYNTLRCGDVSMACSRSAADALFNRWFDNYIVTYLKDIKNNWIKELLLHRRHDSLQGENIMNNNITAIRVKKGRLHRVSYSHLMKEKWKNHNVIELDKTSTTLKNDIKDQMKKFNK
tara:strand:- start:3750 stop:4745 length:996 start_codon:yes stop_codon:yes gene_type:complete